MAKEDLIPMSERSKEEAKELGAIGGKKSGEVRRKKKLMKDQIELLLSLPFPDMKDRNGKKIKDVFKQLGIDEDNIDNQMAMVISMWQKSLKGDVSAAAFLRDSIGEKVPEKFEVTKSTDETIKEIDDYLCKKS